MDINDPKLDCPHYKLQQSPDQTWHQIYTIKWIDHQPNIHFVHQYRKTGCINGNHDKPTYIMYML